MKAKAKDAIALGTIIVVAFTLLYFFSQQIGCAAGVGPDGAVIVGFKVGEIAEAGNTNGPQLVETVIPQAARAVGTAMGGPLGGSVGEMLAQGALAVLGVGGAAAAIRQTKKRGQAEVAAAKAERDTAVAKTLNGKV